MLKKSLIISFLILMVTGISYSENSIRFVVPDFPPYHYKEKGIIKGKGVDLVGQIMKQADIPYTVAIVPNYGRALSDTVSGKADGFFLATRNKERDEAAIFSKAVAMNRWCWFLKKGSKLNPKDTDFKKGAKIGTHLNSNTHKWLKDNGYNVVASPSDVEKLPEMLSMGRMDAVFLADEVFVAAISKLGHTMDNYARYVQEEKPFGIYLSRSYLKNNPGAMEKMNQAIAKLGIK